MRFDWYDDTLIFKKYRFITTRRLFKTCQFIGKSHNCTKFVNSLHQHTETIIVFYKVRVEHFRYVAL